MNHDLRPGRFSVKELERSLFIALSPAAFFIVGVGIVLPAWVALHIGGSGLVGLVLGLGSPPSCWRL